MRPLGRTRALLIPGLIVITVTVVMSHVVSQRLSPQIGLGVVGAGLVCLVWIVMVSPGGLLARERRATEALAESERRYRTLVQTAQDLIWSVDASGEWTFVNDAAKAIYGLDPEALRGTTLMERAEDGKGDGDAQMLIRAMRGEPCLGQVRRHRRADGTVVELSFNAAALRDSDGRVIGATGTASDITNRMRTERELERSESQLRLVTDALPVLISYVDSDRVVRFANRQHADWIRRPVASILGRTIEEILEAEVATEIAPHVRDALRGAHVSFTRRAEHPLLGTRNVRVDLEPHTVSQPWSEARVAGFVALITDETDRLSLESELRHAQMMEAVGQLASGIAHDFNNLLTAMFSQIAVARIRLDGAHPAREIVEELDLTAQQARGVAKFLLSLGRKGSAERSHVDLASLVRQAGHMLRRVLPASITVNTLAPESDHVWVYADSIQLQQTLLNLALNARDAMPTGGVLTVAVTTTHDGSLSADPGGAILSVSDTGHGMEPEVLARIFEPFYTTKPKGRGTGLGLAIIRGIVEDHGGSITARSVPGSGSEFVVHLPRVRPPQETTLVSSISAPDPGSRAVVLLAASGRHVREIMASALAADGFHVLQCSNAEELTRRVRSESSRVQGIVIDLGPVLGARAVTEVRGAGCLAPVVLICDGEPGDPDPQTLVLHKPFAVTTLCRAVKDTINGRDTTSPTDNGAHA